MAASGDTVHTKRSMGVTHSPLTARRVQSASSIQQGGRSQKERRAVIIKTLRSAVQEDQAAAAETSRSTPELKKSATLGAYSKSGVYKTFCERSNSCSSAVANTLDKLADYSAKGVSMCRGQAYSPPSTLSHSSLHSHTHTLVALYTVTLLIGCVC